MDESVDGKDKLEGLTDELIDPMGCDSTKKFALLFHPKIEDSK